MSTRSRIAVKLADGTYRSVHCHFDGYPAGVGATLARHYTDPAKVAALIDLGDLSSLKAEIGEPHAFDDRSDARAHWCTAYGRDRGDHDTAALVSQDFDALVAQTQGSDGQYLYVFADGGWHGFDDQGHPLSPLPPTEEEAP